jgi:hypothetical protein
MILDAGNELETVSSPTTSRPLSFLMRFCKVDRRAVMLNLNRETVQFIIDKAQEFQMLGEEEADDSIEGPDPAHAELKATIEDLEPDQQVSLVALMWLGRGDYAVDEWGRALAIARERWNERTAEYLIGTPLLADYLAEGLAQLSAATE